MPLFMDIHTVDSDAFSVEGVVKAHMEDLARNAIYESGTQILASPTWDKSPNWLQTMQHIAR